jgi:hypothetical protein
MGGPVAWLRAFRRGHYDGLYLATAETRPRAASRRRGPFEVVRLSGYQLISTPIGRRWRNPIAFGSHALSVHGVISRLQ